MSLSQPKSVSEDVLLENTKKLTIKDVRDWAEKHDLIAGRFRFFETYARGSFLYVKVIKIFLSLRLAGSMDVERIAKPLKHQILTKERNMLGDEKATVLLRASENLKLLFDAKMALRTAIHDSKLAGGLVVLD